MCEMENLIMSLIQCRFYNLCCILRHDVFMKNARKKLSSAAQQVEQSENLFNFLPD